ncbi:kelch domain-containing protein 3-like [Chironomus tepperi]|uniref:kelch domain-containing protein 3-like n=1 Tax=Chironomus tepperi TaxID=113505 RepID=UPI00391F70D0
MHWIVALEGGPRRVNHASVSIGEYIYSFGGYCSFENYRVSRPIDIHVLNTNTLRWSLMPMKDQKYPQVPFQRYGHTAVAYENKVYIFGGRNDEMVCDILFCYDTRTNEWSTPSVSGNLPGARDGHSACIKDHYMYIFGGFEEAIDQFSCDVHCLNLKTMQWHFIHTLGTPPSYRDFHTATVINDRMYIYGGRGDVHSPYHSQEEIYCPKIVYLDLRTNQWIMPATIGKHPIGRRSHSAFVYNGLLWIFGGFNGILDLHFNDLHCFDPIRNIWQNIETHGTKPKIRRRQSCVVIGSKMFLFGGTCPSSNSSSNSSAPALLIDYNDTHVLDFSPSLKTLSILAVLKYNLDQSDLPQEVRFEIRMMVQENAISRPLSNMG